MRNARAEAGERVGGRFDVRVLEPSPPADQNPPLFADDPLAGGEVLPIDRDGTRTWESIVGGDDDLKRWCRERWLVPSALAPLPPSFTTTRLALHAVAEHVVAPARHAATTKIGLRFTFHGFGTPWFADANGAQRQLRVEDGELVDGGDRHPLTTLRAASLVAGIEPGATTGVYTPTTPCDLDAELAVDPAAARAVGEWFGFTARLLEQLRADTQATGSDNPSRVQLWPEHFDLAVDLGPDEGRANYGGSPGDEGHPEPYLYVGPWESRIGDFWNEPFGASLPYSEILAGADPLAFLRQGRELLAEGHP